MFSETLLAKVLNAGVSDGAKITFLVLLTTNIRRINKLAFERSLDVETIKAQLAELSANEELKAAWQRLNKNGSVLSDFAGKLERKPKKVANGMADVLGFFTRTAYEKFEVRPAISADDYRRLKRVVRRLGPSTTKTAMENFIAKQPTIKRTTINNFIQAIIL